VGLAALARRRARRRVAAVVPVVLAIAACGTLAVRAMPSTAYANGSESHAARGVVKSFGPGRAFVNIAHEKIDGYMEAMTMSFEPRAAEQLAPLREGDKVSFTFTATSDGRRLLDAIKKE
jgi:Cu/Ag efflux protein CusF